MKKILFITGNKHKLKEARKILMGMQIMSLKDIEWNSEIDEPFHSLEENARHKAHTVYAAHQMLCFAEDTGLEVEVLTGEPGVFSARYAGGDASPDDNMSLLLSKLEGASNRRARFRSIVHLINGDDEYQFEGILSGHISIARTGEGGFGYDPIFVPEGYDNTLAELSESVKNHLSHRAIAMRKMAQTLNY